MQHYNQGYDELYHYGVMGMKWGKRKTNPTKTYSESDKKRIASDLKDHYNRDQAGNNGKNVITSKEYINKVRNVIRNSGLSKQDISDYRAAYKKYMDATYRYSDQKHEDAGRAKATESYHREIKKAPGKYKTRQEKEALYFRLLRDDPNSGYKWVDKHQPGFKKRVLEDEKIDSDFYKKENEIASKILGKYGDDNIHNVGYRFTIKDTISDQLYDVLTTPEMKKRQSDLYQKSRGNTHEYYYSDADNRRYPFE